VFAEHARVELGGHFVVLFVRRRGFDGDRALRKSGYEVHEPLLLALGVTLIFFAKARRQQRTDALADQEVGHEIALEKVRGEGGHRASWVWAGVRWRNTGSRMK
jgi:hypothetical protein